MTKQKSDKKSLFVLKILFCSNRLPKSQILDYRTKENVHSFTIIIFSPLAIGISYAPFVTFLAGTSLSFTINR